MLLDYPFSIGPRKSLQYFPFRHLMVQKKLNRPRYHKAVDGGKKRHYLDHLPCLHNHHHTRTYFPHMLHLIPNCPPFRLLNTMHVHNRDGYLTLKTVPSLLGHHVGRATLPTRPGVKPSVAISPRLRHIMSILARTSKCYSLDSDDIPASNHACLARESQVEAVVDTPRGGERRHCIDCDFSCIFFLPYSTSPRENLYTCSGRLHMVKNTNPRSPIHVMCVHISTTTC